MLLSNTSYANDWGSCAIELDSLRKASSYAFDAANSAESAKSELEDAKEELQNCLDYPSTYDAFGDNCQNLKFDYDSAKNNYEAALSNLESELGSVESKVKSLEWSCGYEIVKRIPVESKKKQLK